jgi:flagellar biosynthesis protein FlhF
MKLKRFVTGDMSEAMQLIRAELGPDAVMVHTRELRPRGLSRLWRRPRLEVLAAVEEDRPPRLPLHLPTATEVEGATRLKRLEERLDGLCRSVESLAARPAGVTAPPTGSELVRFWHQSLSEELVRDLGIANAPDPSRALVAGLKERLPRFAQLTLRGDGPDVFLFLGPTGVGKTTTIAKVAAEFVSRRGCRVGLVSADTFRVAAIPQIEIYADLLGVPLRVAYDPEELRRAVGDLRGYDAVLVDMPGRSPSDEAGLSELKAFLEAVPNARRLLLLQAGSQLRDLRRTARAFQADKCDGLILTKLDETEVFGPAVSIAVELPHPRHYLTVGQNVPQDIEPATADRLLSLLVREGARPQADDKPFVRTGLMDMIGSRVESQA